MAKQLERTTTKRLFRWLKWKALRVVQFVGLVIVGIGGYPFIRPFLRSVIAPPAAVDAFVRSFGVPLTVYAEVPTSSVRAITFVAIGCGVVWLSTSKRLH